MCGGPPPCLREINRDCLNQPWYFHPVRGEAGAFDEALDNETFLESLQGYFLSENEQKVAADPLLTLDTVR